MARNINIRKIIFVLVILGLATGISHYQNYLVNTYANYFATACSRPLSYRVMPVDQQFAISQETFEKAITEASQVWEKSAGKKLFQHDVNGQVPISLIYDSRQKATDQLKKLNLSVDNTQASYDKLKKTYQQDQAQHAALKKQYDALVDQYQNQLKAYNAEVQKINNRGGATKQEGAQLDTQRTQLEGMLAVIHQKLAILNKLVETINALAMTLNRLGGQLNLDVSAYNQVGQNLGEFQEGVFKQDNTGKSITIYQFDNYQQLVRVLAHELGHSLGLNHVEDPEAIMYKLNQSKNATLTKADIVELARVCKL